MFRMRLSDDGDASDAPLSLSGKFSIPGGDGGRSLSLTPFVFEDGDGGAVDNDDDDGDDDAENDDEAK